MIAPLRRAHRVLLLLLSLALAALFVAALRVRPAAPVNSQFPASLMRREGGGQ
ncbi:MAG: hypothetical protein SF339_13235 [Blastocatellia bacterium]|nr:hypothetical protein [Blastocatellia bacterium]